MGISLILDLLVVIIILVSAGVSFFRGIIKEILTIFGFGGGIMAAFFGGGILAPMVKDTFDLNGDNVGKLFGMIPYDMVATIATYGGIFVAVFLLLQLISHFVSSAVRAVGLGPVDRTLGVFFGIARGVLLLGILYLPFHFILPDENKENWFGSSKTFVFVEGTSKWLATFLPNADEADQAENKTTREILENIDVLKSTDKKPKKGEKEVGVAQPSDAESYSDEQRDQLNNAIKSIDEKTLNEKQ